MSCLRPADEAKSELREAFRREALAAWEAYQADGLHLEAHEVDAWLGRLAAGEDVPPPIPHH